MGSFKVSLRTRDDHRGVVAVLHLGRGRLSISAGDVSIGDWSLEEISLTPAGSAYVLEAEGDQIVLEIADRALFEIELALVRTGENDRRSVSRRGDAKRRPRARKALEKSRRRRWRRPDEAPRDRDRSRRPGNPLVRLGDKIVDSAYRRWRSLLPDWVFTRGMLVLVLAAVILIVVLPGVFSIVLLATGGLIILYGAVAYTDTVLASKWLPGRTTPLHVLIVGLIVVLLGLLLEISTS